MGVPKDPYHKETLECLPDGDQHALDEKRIIGLKVTYAVELQQALRGIAPGGRPREELTVRSLSISKRAKDGMLFLAVKATRKVARKDDEAIVCFGSGSNLGEMLYETWQRIALGTAKWRDDVPWQPEDPHDRPEALPKWE